jgi:fermentation-respiration switch protein FrsA (DUF1100 family)
LLTTLIGSGRCMQGHFLHHHPRDMPQVVAQDRMGERTILLVWAVVVLNDAVSAGSRIWESAGWGLVLVSSVARLATSLESVRKQMRTEDKDPRLASISLGQQHQYGCKLSPLRMYKLRRTLPSGHMYYPIVWLC